MPLRRILTRSLVSLGAVAALGTAFVVGTSYGGSGSAGDHPWRGGSGSDASPAAYDGSGLALPESSEIERSGKPRPFPGRSSEIGVRNRTTSPETGVTSDDVWFRTIDEAATARDRDRIRRRA